MRKKVLVVDDDVDVRKLLNVWLQGAGFQVVLAADGYQGVQFARTERPDLILLDISMPAASGFTVSERLSRIGGTGATPIIYMSADPTSEARALAAGGRQFLAKPLTKEAIIQAIEEAFEG